MTVEFLADEPGVPHRRSTRAVPFHAEREVCVSAPSRLSLPEEFLVLSHHPHVKVHDIRQTAVGCAVAELGELALLRRLLVVPKKKRLFGFEVHFTSSRIHLLDLTPTGLSWADGLLAELGSLTVSRSKPTRLSTWLRRRGDEALYLHRQALIEHGSLFPSEDHELHYPNPSVRDVLISWLRAVANEHFFMDERMLFLSDLVEKAELNEDFGAAWSMRRRLDRGRGSGALAVLPEEVRDTSAALSSSIFSRRSGVSAGGGDGDGQ